MKLPWMCSEPDCERPRQGTLELCASHAKAERDKEREKSKPVKEFKPLQRGGPVKKMSDTIRHDGGNGNSYTQAEINELRKRCYNHMDFDGKPPFCSAHGHKCSEWLLDHDHTVAQGRCKQIGKTELIWDEGNIEFSCRTAHREWESYKDGKFIHHKNFEKRMAFVKEHDPEMWEKRIQVWEAYTKPKEII